MNWSRFKAGDKVIIQVLHDDGILTDKQETVTDVTPDGTVTLSDGSLWNGFTGLEKGREVRKIIKAECKHCEHCDTGTNECLRNGKKCYENGKCLRPSCPEYEQGHWGVYD